MEDVVIELISGVETRSFRMRGADRGDDEMERLTPRGVVYEGF